MKTKILLFTTFLFFYFLASSQTYQLTVDSVDYLPLEKSVSLTNGEVWDDDNYSLPIGFDFMFFERSTNVLYLDSNGFIADDLAGQDSVFSAVIPFLNDLIDLGYELEKSASNISYLLQGEEGERILKIEWNNAGFYDDMETSTPSYINFQVWLYEIDNTIEFHFGENRIQEELVFQYYGGGPLIGLLNNLNDFTDEYDEFMALTGEPSNPTAFLWDGEIDFNYGPSLLSSTPSPNTVYRFNNMSVSTTGNVVNSNEFTVYPNPVEYTLSVASKNSDNKIIAISMYSSDGRLVKSISSDFSYINVSELQGGIYHLNIQSEEGVTTKRFVKVE